jgi:hypothetical protein
MGAYTRSADRLRAVGEPLHVLIDKIYRNNVCYVTAECRDRQTDDYNIRPQGTAFFAEEMVGLTAVASYAVTARHLIEDIHADQKAGKCGRMFLRVNLHQGGFKDLPVKYEDWIRNPNTDVAVCPVHFKPDVNFFAFSSVAGIRGELRPGYDVFFVGLFQKRPGHDSMDAIVRFGKLALPLTDVDVNLSATETKTVTAYLVESRSWGGESGSPVFLYDQNWEMSSYDTSSVHARDVHPPLLGLLHGHYEIDREVQPKTRKNQGSFVEVNSGIAVVIPADEIRATLFDDRLLRDREAMKKKIEDKARKENMPKRDRLAQSGEHVEFSKSDFEAALKKVSRKRPRNNP